MIYVMHTLHIAAIVATSSDPHRAADITIRRNKPKESTTSKLPRITESDIRKQLRAMDLNNNTWRNTADSHSLSARSPVPTKLCNSTSDSPTFIDENIQSFSNKFYTSTYITRSSPTNNNPDRHIIKRCLSKGNVPLMSQSYYYFLVSIVYDRMVNNIAYLDSFTCPDFIAWLNLQSAHAFSASNCSNNPKTTSRRIRKKLNCVNPAEKRETINRLFTIALNQNIFSVIYFLENINKKQLRNSRFENLTEEQKCAIASLHLYKCLYKTSKERFDIKAGECLLNLDTNQHFITLAEKIFYDTTTLNLVQDTLLYSFILNERITITMRQCPDRPPIVCMFDNQLAEDIYMLYSEKAPPNKDVVLNCIMENTREMYLQYDGDKLSLLFNIKNGQNTQSDNNALINTTGQNCNLTNISYSEYVASISNFPQQASNIGKPRELLDIQFITLVID